VKGFATTLMIGIAASLFSALIIARLIFDYMTSKNLSVDVG
jgi:preprotein translocase subunit SecD